MSKAIACGKSQTASDSSVVSRCLTYSRVMGMKLRRIILVATVLSGTAGAQSPPVQGLWASLGVGGSAKGILLMGAASYSRGAIVFIARASGTEAFKGPSGDSRAILAGMRGQSARFALAAIGIGRSRSWFRRSVHPEMNASSRTTLAFQFQVHPDFDVTPLGLCLLGEAGPGDSSYLGAVITLDLGSFGFSR